jgi:dihydrofolate synthase/folylpolyglutamate synthase
MTYLESLNYINNNLTSGSVYGLSRIKELLKRLGNPQKCMNIIHIAGTNGKGSISRMIMSILKAAGYTVGIFNSPYLEKKNEYLCVNGVDATDDEYALIAGIAKRAVESVPMEEKPTEFEFSFAMAMEYFARKNCDFAIVECGLGGLTDATNIFDEKELSIIANIGLDHTKLLGDTIKDIAKQKCGIIIKNDTVIAYPSDKDAIKTIKRVCKSKNAKLITPDYIEFGTMSYYNPGFPDNDPVLENEKVWLNMPLITSSIALKGSFQKRNGMVALAAVMELASKGFKITYNNIINGLKNVTWPGRFETLCKEPLIIADGGHNLQCVKALCDSLDSEGISKAIFVIGIMADKDYKDVFKQLYPYTVKVVATEPANPRRLSTEEICKCFSELSNSDDLILDDKTHRLLDIDIYAEKIPAEAVKAALKLDRECYNNKMPIIITGSLYMMSEIRRAVLV